MRKKRLEILLSRIPPHPRPRLELEQYATPPHLAARLLWVAVATYHDLLGGVVLDLGAGTGRLGLGAALLGSPYVVLVDLDHDALRIALSKARELRIDERVDAVCADVRRFETAREASYVVQNPPFGVHRRGADVEFMAAALKLARVVYSVHKAESVDYVLERCREAGAEARLLFREVIRLPPTMPHHRKREHVVDVAVIRASRELG
ncbi:MAG: methylase [Thermoprotei archaeon]|nr:methyltransferase [Thermoproteales archaeon]RLE88876.1 MAG: methylase [Thermoprotei archaeon]RLE96649.1 MAG: methylase [Thermoprotei archaeon]